jgi:monoterpene epsilon-lactone hydrolase
MAPLPSLRSRLIRIYMQRVVAKQFRRAGTSVAAWRRLDRLMIKTQRVPKGTGIEPIRVGGVPCEWVRAPGVAEGHAVLYLHGGAMLMCSPATHRELAARLSAEIGAPLLLPDFRLAPEHPFPAALEDTIAVYRWLLDSGWSADRLAIGGDSSGGGLALQTLLSLRDAGTPLPATAFAMSPVANWVQLRSTAYAIRAAVDPLLTLETMRWSSGLYVADHDRNDPLLFLPGADLSGLPPLAIHVGEDEILLSDATRLAERARAAGVEVELTAWPGMWHGFPATASVVPEAKRCLKMIGRSMRQHLAPLPTARE